MLNKALIICFIIFLLCAAILPAQTAAEMESILNSKAVNYGQAALFVIASAGNANNIITQQAAFNMALTNGWIPKDAVINDPIKLGKLSFLIMEAFDMKGGLMYSILPGPRYAFRSLESRSVIQGIIDPGMTVSGEWFLRILGNVLNIAEDDK